VRNKQESLAGAKVGARQQCAYEGPCFGAKMKTSP